MNQVNLIGKKFPLKNQLSFKYLNLKSKWILVKIQVITMDGLLLTKN